MKGIEWQVCSLESARMLKALGVRQESAFWWVYGVHQQKWVVFGEILTSRKEEKYSAFTVAELG